ncbi:MAG: Gfo/Idh/MocA family oxidoreductase [Gemmatimonadota bacterium]|nr:Gfo/Idh/MocA family oxidoreductase [Gemmatimonadota bacterium]
MNAQPEPLRIAILGAGAIAQVVHIPVLTRMPGVEVAAVCDTDRGKADSVAARFGIPNVFHSDDRLWKEADFDGVVICTPSHLHEAQVQQALAAGKYVLCEKPLALTAEGVERVLASEGADGRLMVAMNQRYRPDASALQTFVARGELGDVFYLRTGWFNRRIGRGRPSWRHQKALAGGGALIDLGIQMLDLALWLLGYPEAERVVAHLHRERPMRVEDSAVVLIRLEDGRVVNLEVTWNLLAEQERQYLYLLGTAGTASLSPFTVFRQRGGGLSEVTPQLPPGSENLFTASYRRELQYFVDVVRGERKAKAPTEHVRLMRVIEAAYRSARERREVTVG